jgi:CubicO group peptidase (beta-lactamase class C family)
LDKKPEGSNAFMATSVSLSLEMRMMRSLAQLLLISLISVFYSDSLLAQLPVTRLDGSTISPENIDAIVRHEMGIAHVQGVDIAVFNSGKVVYLKTYGVRDEATHLPLT